MTACAIGETGGRVYDQLWLHFADPLGLDTGAPVRTRRLPL